jgi:hypothetical protein
MKTVTLHDGTQVPTPERGAILMARPLFANDQGNWKLGDKEHPVVVLKTVVKEVKGQQQVLAIVLPMTHSESALRNPNALPMTSLQTRGMTAHAGKQNHLVTDSPNVVVLNGPDNGVRPKERGSYGQAFLEFGQVTDPHLLTAAEAMMKSFVSETRYKVPVQGDTPGLQGEHHRFSARPDMERRRKILTAAAEQVATQSVDAMRVMAPAFLRAGMAPPAHAAQR